MSANGRTASSLDSGLLTPSISTLRFLRVPHGAENLFDHSWRTVRKNGLTIDEMQMRTLVAPLLDSFTWAIARARCTSTTTPDCLAADVELIGSPGPPLFSLHDRGGAGRFHCLSAAGVRTQVRLAGKGQHPPQRRGRRWDWASPTRPAGPSKCIAICKTRPKPTLAWSTS
jgi:hypothetical protein